MQREALFHAGAELAAATGTQRGGLEHEAVAAAEQGLVDLQACAESLPVQRADLRADAPEGHGFEVFGRDACALREHPHQVVRIVLRDLYAVCWKVGEQTRLGDVDEVVVRAVFQHGGVPAVVGGFYGLCVHAEGGEFRDDGAGGCGFLFVVVCSAGELFFFVFIFRLVIVFFLFFSCV